MVDYHAERQKTVTCVSAKGYIRHLLCPTCGGNLVALPDDELPGERVVMCVLATCAARDRQYIVHPTEVYMEMRTLDE